MPRPPRQRWFDLSSSTCQHCGEEDWTSEYGERMLLICTGCGAGCAHIGCEQSSTGQEYDEDFVDSGADWFCSEVRA